MDNRDPALRRLVDQVRSAASEGRPLDLRGGGTKAFYGEAPHGEPLELRALAGISSLEPTELVVTARAGTPLDLLEAALAEHGQHLAFEPPRFAADGTVGGMVAAGLAGPARAAAGGVRDHLLGATMLDGRGQVLSFGGQVMKNVAGYDIARALAGSMGVLGAVLEVSLKVLPLPPASRTIEIDCDEAAALGRLNAWRRQPLPLNASAWHDGRLRLRLAGARSAIDAAAAKLSGRALDANEAAAWWTAVRDHRHDFFRPGSDALLGGLRLWRLSVPATAAPLALPGEGFVEWGGAQRWLLSRAEPNAVRAATAAAGGHATIFRAADKAGGAFAPLAPALARLHERLKAAFDPQRVLNPGRLYAGL
jgi:FAD/FMN-containing dehydrogenase